MSNHIKAIIFDLDNTLLDFDEASKEALTYLFKKLKLKVSNEIINEFNLIDEQLWSLKDYTIDVTNKRFELLFKKFDIDFNDFKKANELYIEGLKKGIYLINGSLSIVEKLFEKGYDLYIASNGNSIIQKERFRQTPLYPFFKKMYISDMVGYSKPDIEFFEYIISDLNISGEEAIMIGDSLEKDIFGAKKVNINTIWYNPNFLEDTLDIEPDFTIFMLKDIIYIVLVSFEDTFDF